MKEFLMQYGIAILTLTVLIILAFLNAYKINRDESKKNMGKDIRI